MRWFARFSCNCLRLNLCVKHVLVDYHCSNHRSRNLCIRFTVKYFMNYNNAWVEVCNKISTLRLSSVLDCTAYETWWRYRCPIFSRVRRPVFYFIPGKPADTRNGTKKFSEMENGESTIDSLTDEIVYYYLVGRVCVSRTRNTVAISLECRYMLFFLDFEVNHLSSKAKNIKNIT